MSPREILLAIAGAGYPVEYMHTGGGCGTLYVGTMDPETDRFECALGPFGYDDYDVAIEENGDGDFSMSRDDDGESLDEVIYPKTIDEILEYLKQKGATK